MWVVCVVWGLLDFKRRGGRGGMGWFGFPKVIDGVEVGCTLVGAVEREERGGGERGEEGVCVAEMIIILIIIDC